MAYTFLSFVSLFKRYLFLLVHFQFPDDVRFPRTNDCYSNTSHSILPYLFSLNKCTCLILGQKKKS